VRKVYELSVVHVVAKNLGQGDCFIKVSDSKGDSVDVGSRVGSNVPALAVVADIISTVKGLFD
jgi:hypothetical protein